MHINESKINKYQAGGLFPVYQPLPLNAPMAPEPKVTGSGTTGNQGAPALDKEIVKKLMGEGIANDVISFSNSLNGAYEEYATLTDFEKNTARGQRLRDLMKGDLGTLNLLMRNKKEFDQSIEKVKSQDAYGELAITARGLVVKDLQTGKLAEISHQDYASDLRKQNERKYQALTNAELINEREYNPNLVNDRNSINSLNSSTGMETVKKEITSVLANLGSDSKSETKGFYANTGDSEEIKRAARQIVGMSKEGIYKIEQMASNETNERQLKSAASAMWTNLSASARSLLKARAVSNGADPADIEEAALGYALSLLNPASKTVSSSKTDANYDDALNKSTKGTGEDSGSVGYYETLTAQAGNPNYMQVDLGNGDLLTALGSVSGPLQHEGKPTGQTSIRNIPELKGVANFNNMYFGDNKVDVNFADAVVYTGDDAMNVELPAIRDVNGGMKPNFDIMPKYNAVMKQLEKAPNNMMAREKIITSAGFQMNAQGQIDVPKANFITFHGMINDQALGTSNYNKRLVRNVDGNLEKQYEKSYRFNGESPDKEGTDLKPQEYDRWFGARWANPLDVLQGMVFIEAKVNPVGARMVDGKDIVTSKANNTIMGLNQLNIFNKPASNNKGVIPAFQFNK